MAFDADEYVEAHHHPPAFRWKGRRYVGRILSAAEWVRLHAQRDQAQSARVGRAARAVEGDELTDAAMGTVVEEALRAAERFTRDMIMSWFPVPWYRRPLAWLMPGLFHPAWRAFRQMPPRVQVEAVKDFSESQRHALPQSQPPGTTVKDKPTLDPHSDT